MDIKWLAQQTKHAAFIASKKARLAVKNTHFKAYDLLYMNKVSPDQYTFEKARYRRSFLNRDIVPYPDAHYELPRVVYCFWTGENEMSEARAHSLQVIRSVMKAAPVHLVTPENLHSYVLEDYPLHPAYERLSLVHRSDYLRAYFMHHYGGGYLDIKRIPNDWAASFELLDNDPEKWALGYQEATSRDVAKLTGNLGHDIKKFHRILIGNGAYIFKRGTPFTAEWLSEQERRLDYFYPQLIEFPGGTRGEVVGYPLSWHDLLGRVFHPLCLKFADRLIIDNRIKPEFTDYL